MQKEKLHEIKRLVGEASKEQLRYVDSFVSEKMALFMPVGGACFFALSPLHSHPAYMFVLHFDDRTSLRLGRRAIRPGHGNLFALSPDIPHHELPTEGAPRYIAVFIEKGFFERVFQEYRSKPPFFNGELFEATPNIVPLLKGFMVEADGRLPGRDSALYGLGVSICHALIRNVLGVCPNNDRITARVEISRAIEHMHANISEKLTLKRLSTAARMSPSHFSHVFKEETGRSPLEYLSMTRMELVKKLLLAGEKSLTEIAFDCGLKSPAYLSASFRKSFGISPSGYLKRLKNRISKKNGRITKD